MCIKPFFDSPKHYENTKSYFYEGSSPKLLESLIQVIEENKNKIDEIKISLYLYNNPKLHSYIKKAIEETSIKFTIVSIPLEGYDNSCAKPLNYLHKPSKCTKAFTKYGIAKRIYDDILKMNSVQYKMFIFPHMYIRSKYVKPFSRGRMPYSLHAKLFCFKYKGKQVGDIAISSSAFAGRDLVKEENLLIIEGNNQHYNSMERFFNDLISNSIELGNYQNRKAYFEYKLKVFNDNLLANHLFVAPFYEGSPEKSEGLIIQLIRKAKERIYIVAQHISSYEYSYEGESGKTFKRGFLYYALEKAKENNLELKCLSQTYVNELGDSLGCRRPANIKMFKKFVRAYKKAKKAQYAVNDRLHSKYIIIDNKLIVTSCNFTPTQFIYIKNIDIDSFVNIPYVHYKGIHSEVGAYFIIEDKNTIDKYVHNMFDIWKDKSTKIVI